jgi:DNA-binding transcriptional LysR family regulator
MDRDLDLSLLRTFLTIAMTGSFTAASHRLFRTQPAISLRIKRLEDMVGFPLINRLTEGVSLTREGDLLFGYAKRIVALNDELVGRMRRAGAGEVIRIGLPEEYTAIDLEAVLKAFTAACPATSIVIDVKTSSELTVSLRDDRFDLIVSVCSANMSESLLARRSPVVWVAGEQAISPYEDEIALVLPTEGNLYRQMALQALANGELSWTVSCTVTDWNSARSAILAGMGLSVVSRDMVAPGMRLVGEEMGLPPLPDIGISLTRRPQSKSDAARQLAELLEESLTADEVRLPFLSPMPS